MATRILSRWTLSIGLALITLAGINLLLAKAPVQARHAAAFINCSGSIQACINAANDGDTILIAPGRYTESLTLSKPVSLTGVSSDTTIIHAMAGQRVLTVTGATISNSVVISGLTVTGGRVLEGLGYLENCGGGMLVTIMAEVIIQNVIFFNNAAAEEGGGLYIGSDYGIPAAATLINSQFISNTAAQIGGGVAGDGSMTLIDSQFISNTSQGVGGGLGVGPSNVGSITLIGGQFISNTSQGEGGGLGTSYSYDSPVLITGTHFINNAALGTLDGLGGGVLVWGTVIITGGYFEGNVSHGSNGGGLFALTFIVTNTDFVSNTVAGWGGGASGSEATISGGRFERNFSGGAGGGISVNFASISGTNFVSNTSDAIQDYIGGGGAFVVIQGEFINARFESNQCLTTGCNGGGALLEGDSHVANTLFFNNFSAGDGTAIATNAPGHHELEHLTIAGTNLITKPAVVALSGTLYLTNTIIASHTIAISNTDGTVYEDYNLFFGNITNAVGVITGSHSLIGDPKFVDPLNGDYHLQLGSAAIDHGVDAGITTDLDGHPRPVGAGFDIGAYEFSGGPRYVATTGNDTSNDCFDEAHPCATMQHAVDAATPGDEIRVATGVYTDVHVREAITQVAYLSKTLTLRGGYTTTNWLTSNPTLYPTTLDAQARGRVLTIIGAVTLTVEGFRITGGDAAGLGGDLTWGSNAGGGVLVISATATLTNNIIFSNTTDGLGGGIFIAKAAQPILQNLRLISNTASGGGGLATDYSYEYPLTLVDTHFINNGAHSADGGGALIWGSAVVLNSHFENNFCDNGFGGGLYAWDVIITGSDFISNTAWSGGGLLAKNSALLTHVNFTSNTATYQGGGLYALDGSTGPAILSNVSFIGNIANDGGAGAMIQGIAAIADSHFEGNVSNSSYYAGGIYAHTVQMTNTTLISNSSGHAGGAQAQYAYINGGRFERNTSTGWGGGLAVSNLFMTGTVVISNTAGGGGGAWVPGITWLSGVRFENNRALGNDPTWSNGGGLLAEFDSLFISDTYFINNSAVTYGGGLSFNSDLPGHVINTVFVDNHSDSDGAAIATTAGGRLDLLHTTVAAATLNPRPALGVLSGTLHLTNTIIASHTIAISNTDGIVTEDYNLFFNNLTNTIGVITDGGHSLIGDPKFGDPLHGNYRLRYDSAAIDHGVDAGVYTDLDDHPRPFGAGFDIGAYEFSTTTHRLYLPLVRK